MQLSDNYMFGDAIMLETRQIHSLTDFLRNHKAHVARLKETKAPEILTVNGRAEIVIQDAESYQVLLDKLHHMETLTAIKEGMASAERGELKPAEQVFAEMRAKYGLHG
jgi:PHD/YefM family antitoxin component YafN of YafNO toxin-antitoxin module